MVSSKPKNLYKDIMNGIIDKSAILLNQSLSNQIPEKKSHLKTFLADFCVQHKDKMTCFLGNGHNIKMDLPVSF